MANNDERYIMVGDRVQFYDDHAEMTLNDELRAMRGTVMSMKEDKERGQVLSVHWDATDVYPQGLELWMLPEVLMTVTS